MNLEKERVCRGLREAITMLCKTGLRFDTELSVEGLLGITLDRNEVFLVSIKDTVSVSETDGNLDEYCAEEQQQVEDTIDGRLDITVPEGVTLTGHVLDDDNSLDNSSFLRLNQGLTTHSSRRKSKPMNRNIMSGKAPRKSSTPTQIIQGHMLEPNGTIMHSTNSPLPLSGGIRSVNMNRHILKVPTAHNIHAKHDVKSSFSDDQPVDLQKPKNRNTGKVVENNPPASDPDQTDTLVMIHAYNNTSGYNTQSDKLDQRASVTNAENNRTSLSVKTCLERSYVSNPGSCMSSRDNIETMGDMQDEPIALTCDGTQSSASSVLTNSSANSPKPDVNLAADDYRKHVSPAQGGIEGVLVKPEPIDLEDLQNSGALNCTQPMGGNLPLEGKSADANSTIASLLKAGHGLMGIPLRGYIPPAIPYALDFSGTERSQVVATDLSMIQVSESSDSSGNILGSAATGSNSGSEADGKDGSRGRSLSGSLNRRSGVMCSNCGTSVTTMWRRSHEGLPICNPCGLYYKLHNVERPMSLVRGQIYSRKRKPKTYKQESCKYMKSESSESHNNTMENESQGDSSSST